MTSPREQTRLLGSLCIELAKGQEQVWVNLQYILEMVPREIETKKEVSGKRNGR